MPYKLHHSGAELTYYLDVLFDDFCSQVSLGLWDNCRHHPVHLIVRDLTTGTWTNRLTAKKQTIISCYLQLYNVNYAETTGHFWINVYVWAFKTNNTTLMAKKDQWVYRLIWRHISQTWMAGFCTHTHTITKTFTSTIHKYFNCLGRLSKFEHLSLYVMISREYIYPP